MTNENLLFYDVEVFSHDNLVVLMDYDENVVYSRWNPAGDTKLDEVIEGKTLVGFNNYSYDDKILYQMLLKLKGGAGVFKPSDIKRLNDRLVSGRDYSHESRVKNPTLDTMQQISVSHPSLKLIEGNMGRSIIETPVDFNLDRPLTPNERRTVQQYCVYDVKSTIAVYKLRERSYFETKEWLIQALPEDLRGNPQRWTTGTISSRLLRPDGTNATRHTREWAINQLERYGAWRNETIPDDVWDFWDTILKSDDSYGTEEVEVKKTSCKKQALDCEFVFGIGGLHGAPKKPGVFRNIKLADVGSMYPSIIVMLEALGDATTLYNEMRLERLKVKKTDKVKADSLKLVLNSCYGNFKNEYSIIYDPIASDTVCIFGQVALFTLCKQLHDAGYQIVNANTDGVAFVDDPVLNGAYLHIQHEWEERFNGMVLEVDEFDGWIQKDVNNYVATTGGKIKTKGGEVNKYAADRFFDNNSVRITHIALVDALVSRITDSSSDTRKIIRKSVAAHSADKLLFQYVLRAGSTFKGVIDQNGEVQQKVNRVFATIGGETKLYKVRADGARVNFPNLPDNGTVWNGEVADFTGQLDLEYYENLAIEKARGWGIVC